MRQVILKTQVTYLVKPGLWRGSSIIEDVLGMTVKNVVGESGDHSEYGQLPKVKDSRARKATSKKACD